MTEPLLTWLSAQHASLTAWGAMTSSQRLVEQMVAGVAAHLPLLQGMASWRAAAGFLIQHPVVVYGADLERTWGPGLHSTPSALWLAESTLIQEVDRHLDHPVACWPAHAPRVGREHHKTTPDRLTFGWLSSLLLAQAYRQARQGRSSLPPLLEKQGGRSYPARALARTSEPRPRGSDAWARPPLSPTASARRLFLRASVNWLRHQTEKGLLPAGKESSAATLAHLEGAGVRDHPAWTDTWLLAVRQVMTEHRRHRRWDHVRQTMILGQQAHPQSLRWRLDWRVHSLWHQVTQRYIVAPERYRGVDEAMGFRLSSSSMWPDVGTTSNDALWWSLVARCRVPSSMPSSGWWKGWWWQPRGTHDAGLVPSIFEGPVPDWDVAQRHALRSVPWTPATLRVNWGGVTSEATAQDLLDGGVDPTFRVSPRSPSLLMVAMERGWSQPFIDRLVQAHAQCPVSGMRLQGCLVRRFQAKGNMVLLPTRKLLAQATNAYQVRGLMAAWPMAQQQVAQVIPQAPLQQSAHVSGVYRELLRWGAPPSGQVPHWMVHHLVHQSSGLRAAPDRASRTRVFALLRWLRAAPDEATLLLFPWREWWRAPWVKSLHTWRSPRTLQVLREAVSAACLRFPGQACWKAVREAAERAWDVEHPGHRQLAQWQAEDERGALERLLEDRSTPSRGRGRI